MEDPAACVEVELREPCAVVVGWCFGMEEPPETDGRCNSDECLDIDECSGIEEPPAVVVAFRVVTGFGIEHSQPADVTGFGMEEPPALVVVSGLLVDSFIEETPACVVLIGRIEDSFIEEPPACEDIGRIEDFCIEDFCIEEPPATVEFLRADEGPLEVDGTGRSLMVGALVGLIL